MACVCDPLNNSLEVVCGRQVSRHRRQAGRQGALCLNSCGGPEPQRNGIGFVCCLLLPLLLVTSQPVGRSSHKIALVCRVGGAAKAGGLSTDLKRLKFEFDHVFGPGSSQEQVFR